MYWMMFKADRLILLAACVMNLPRSTVEVRDFHEIEYETTHKESTFELASNTPEVRGRQRLACGVLPWCWRGGMRVNSIVS